MNIVIIVPSYYPAFIYGGPIFSIHFTSLALARLGVKIFVSTTNANGSQKLDVAANEFIILENNYHVKYYDDLIIGRFSWKFNCFVWKDIFKSDVVHIQDIFSTYVLPSFFYSLIFNKPILISPRGSLSTWSISSKHTILKKVWLSFFIRPFYRRVWWHATSTQEKEEIIKNFPNAFVVVIPNAVQGELICSLSSFDRDSYVKRFTGLDNFKFAPIIISMGRLHYKKGFDILIDAFCEIHKIYKNSLLLIAGADDGEMHNLKQRVDSLSLSQFIIFVGEILGNDKYDFLRGGDVFVLPSRNENFGNVYLEALACGVPIVASKSTPWSEVEVFGCGKWVENTVDATAGAMIELLKADRTIISIRAKKFSKKYNWDNVAKDFKETFELMTQR